MKQIISSLLTSIVLALSAVSAIAAEVEVINEALFSLVGNETSTTRDHHLYKAVLSEVFQKKQISSYSPNDVQDFLLSRMAYKEAQVFSFTPDPVKISDSARKKMDKYEKAEIESEVQLVSQALAWVQLKENQLKDRERFNNWVDVLKRKYQLKIKSSEYR